MSKRKKEMAIANSTCIGSGILLIHGMEAESLKRLHPVVIDSQSPVSSRLVGALRSPSISWFVCNADTESVDFHINIFRVPPFQMPTLPSHNDDTFAFVTDK